MDRTEKMNIYLDKCIGHNDTHYDIANYIYQVIKDKYKYDEKINKWLYLDKEDKTNLSKLKKEIKTNIVNQFIMRSVYWNNNEICSIILLKIANKLKNDIFIRDIIKEIKQFY
jgi:hypothetical protein